MKTPDICSAKNFLFFLHVRAMSHVRYGWDLMLATDGISCKVWMGSHLRYGWDPHVRNGWDLMGSHLLSLKTSLVFKTKHDRLFMVYWVQLVPPLQHDL